MLWWCFLAIYNRSTISVFIIYLKHLLHAMEIEIYPMSPTPLSQRQWLNTNRGVSIIKFPVLIIKAKPRTPKTQFRPSKKHAWYLSHPSPLLLQPFFFFLQSFPPWHSSLENRHQESENSDWRQGFFCNDIVRRWKIQDFRAVRLETRFQRSEKLKAISSTVREREESVPAVWIREDPPKMREREGRVVAVFLYMEAKTQIKTVTLQTQTTQTKNPNVEGLGLICKPH